MQLAEDRAGLKKRIIDLDYDHRILSAENMKESRRREEEDRERRQREAEEERERRKQ